MKTCSKSPIINKLLEANKEYINNADKNFYAELEKGQSPFALIVSCSDSRVVPEHIFLVPAGSLFVIRTAGNVINEGELASIEYGIEHLKIKTIIVLAHTNCGAIHATIRKEKGKYLSPILDNISYHIIDECDETKASKLNALGQVNYIKEKFKNFKVDVVAMIYDIQTLKVDLID